jgi:ATP-dependent Clp protease adaptor protein ClpS
MSVQPQKIDQAEELRTVSRPNRRYGAVVFHNDNVTPMGFVTAILIRLYNKTEREAYNLMMEVHNSGRCQVGRYPHEIADALVQQTQAVVTESRFPLKVSLEDLDE